jgi:predicted nucleic acid-binding protein
MRAGVLSGPRLADRLLAATAQIHGHGLLTTRIDDFIPLQTGIELKDPFE